MVGSIGPGSDKPITKKDLKEEIYRMAGVINRMIYDRTELLVFLQNRILYLDMELRWEDEHK